jgi:hypothetical protein
MESKPWWERGQCAETSVLWARALAAHPCDAPDSEAFLAALEHFRRAVQQDEARTAPSCPGRDCPLRDR